MLPSAKQEDRRFEVCEATWDVIARDGLDNATLRSIAHELGMTTGVLMHYFRSRDDLISFALEELMNRLNLRIERLMKGKVGLARVEGMLLGALPIDEKDHRGWRIWLAVTGASVGKVELLRSHRAHYAQLRQRVVKELKKAQKEGLLADGVVIAAEADAIFELTDGIGVGWFIDPEHYTVARQKAAVHRYLSRISP